MASYIIVYLLIGLGCALNMMATLMNSDEVNELLSNDPVWISSLASMLYCLYVIIVWPLYLFNLVKSSRKKNTPDNERSDEHDS